MLDKINQYYTRGYISQHYEDWDSRIFEKYDINEYLETLDKLDPDVVIVTSRTHNGKWFCNIENEFLHKGLKGVDQLARSIEYFHAKGKPVVTYFSTVYDKVLYDLHPQWRQVDNQGNPVSTSFGNTGKVVCLNSPYKEYVIDMIGKMIKTHDLDGILLDMTFWEPKPCYCDNCKKLFKSMYNAQIPDKEDWDNPLFLKFVKFRHQTNYIFVKEICDSIKRINPRIATYFQYLLMKESTKLEGQGLKLASAADYIYSDVYFETGYLHFSVVTKIDFAVSKNIPEIGIMTRPGNHNDTPNMKPLDQLRAEAFTVIANGGAVHFFDIMWSDGSLHEAMWSRNKTVFDEIKQRKAWLGGKPVKSVAVFFSENSRLWYGKSDPAKRYDMNFLGMCRSLIEEHVVFTIITKLDKESLKGFKTLVLPNTACMSAAEAAVVEAFVKAGGGLVTTEKTSLYDEEGNAWGEFKLSDVLGLSYISDTSAYSRVYSKFDTTKRIAARLPADGFITSWGELQKVELKDAQKLATITYPYIEPTAERFVNIMANPPALQTEWPACTYHEFGKGKVVSFLGGIDKDYLIKSFPELKYLIVDSIKAVSGERSDIELKAPMSVEMTAFEKNNGSQTVIHLINYQPETGKTFIEKGAENRHLVQEILPVYNLVLSVKVSGTIDKILLQPENTIPEYSIKDSYININITCLNCHSMVVIDYKK